MLRIIIFAFALLINPAMAAAAEMQTCSQISDLSATRRHWAAVRKGPVNPALNEESCRSYAMNFFAAVTARQAASFCTDSFDRERTLKLLDAEIEAFNDLLAMQCSG
jgi:hypothetical protein